MDMKDQPASLDLGPLEENYQIEGELRRDTRVRVFRAKRRADDRQVEVAVAKANADDERHSVEHLASDATILAGNPHPSLAGIVEGRWLGDDAVAVVRDRIDGAPLSELIAQGQSYTNPRIAKFLESIREGLAWAREHGVVHRTISADTIFVDRFTERAVTTFDFAPLSIHGVPGEDEDARQLAVIGWTLMTGQLVEGERPPLIELRPDLAKRVVDEIECALAPTPERAAPSSTALIATIAMSDILKEGEVETAVLQAETIEHLRAMREQWDAERAEMERLAAEEAQRCANEQAALRQAMAEQQEQLDAERATFDQDRTVLDQTIAQMQQDRASLDQSIAEQKEEQALFEQARAEMEQERASLQDSLAAAEQERASLQDAVAAATQERASYETARADLAANEESLRHELSERSAERAADRPSREVGKAMPVVAAADVPLVRSVPVADQELPDIETEDEPPPAYTAHMAHTPSKSLRERLPAIPTLSRRAKRGAIVLVAILGFGTMITVARHEGGSEIDPDAVSLDLSRASSREQRTPRRDPFTGSAAGEVLPPFLPPGVRSSMLPLGTNSTFSPFNGSARRRAADRARTTDGQALATSDSQRVQPDSMSVPTTIPPVRATLPGLDSGSLPVKLTPSTSIRLDSAIRLDTTLRPGMLRDTSRRVDTTRPPVKPDTTRSRR
jgi:hypothetical protein